MTCGRCCRCTLHARCRAFFGTFVVPVTSITSASGRRYLSFSSWTHPGTVALNSSVCSGVVRSASAACAASMIRETCSAKPILSISSASSRTIVCRFRSETVPRSRWSTSRPGVATMTSARRRRRCACPPKSTPPYRQTTLGPPHAQCANSSSICFASSRVGERHRTDVPNFGRAARSRSISGSANESVFPLPVSAFPMMSCRE